MKVDFTSKRLVAKTLVCIVILLCFHLTALAHAKLVQSQPKANETLTVVPRTVELWFSEPLEPGLNTIEVLDQTGKRVDQGEVVLAEDNEKAFVNLAELPPGVYTARWKTLSADQHTIRGTFRFTVTESAVAATAVATPTQGVPSPTTALQTETPIVNEAGDTIGWAQTLVRWVSYLTMMVLFGGFAFRLFVITPALTAVAGPSDKNKLLEVADRRIVATAWVATVVLFLTSVLALVLQASDVFDTPLTATLSPSVLVQVLRSGYGPSWLLQVGSLSALLIVVLVISKSGSVRWWWIGLLAAALLFAAPSWTGHARLSAKHFRFAVISDWLHLIAGGFWVGGLFHLALIEKTVFSKSPPAQRAFLLHRLITSFTRIAVPSVVLLFLSGLYNTWAHLSAISALWITPYGRALGLKLMFVMVMLLLGSVNNYYFGKRAARFVDDGDSSHGSAIRIEYGFLRSVRFEAALGIIVLLVTAVLVFLTPARDHPAMDQARTGTESLRHQ